jgi:RNA polymerase sigma factor (TIGR02999 family)
MKGMSFGVVSEVEGSSEYPENKVDSSPVELTTTLYGKLRKLANERMATQYEQGTIQATALLHEAWLKLGGDEQPKWKNRAHFYSAVAQAMRHILVDRARKRQYVRHGGGMQRVDLDCWNWETADPWKADQNDKMVLVVNEALQRLESEDPEVADVIKLHYFVGLSIGETAETLQLSRRTTERRLAYARVWLSEEIKQQIGQ